MKHSKDNKRPFVHAPYNFVPNKTSFLPIGWRNKTTIDVPLENGICGEMTITLNTHSPLMIGGEVTGNNPIPFFNVDGKPVIPGSSVRGMLKAVSEIVTFSKFQGINQQYPTMRNIQDEHYKNQLNQGNKLAVKAGWLSFDASSKTYQMRKSDYARVSYDLISQWCNTKSLKYEKDISRKYQRAGGLSKTFDFDAKGTNSRGEWVASRGDDYEGWLVFSGQGLKKAAEYIFFNEEDDTYEIDNDVMQAFLTIYDDGVAEKSPLSMLKRVVKAAGDNVPGIPVFYIPDNSGKVKFIGLTPMMKIPPNYSVHDLLPSYKKQIESGNTIDMTENLFGRIENEKIENSYSLKSRVSFSDLHFVQGELATSPVELILSQPSASFFPSYLQQSADNSESALSQRQTNYHADTPPTLRGFKRYPVQTNVPLQPLMPHMDSNNNNENVRKRILPIREGASFAGKVRFHNITPNELGLLCWLITWGGDKSLHHSLGMAKPYGYGNVSLSLDSLELEKNNEPGHWQVATYEVQHYSDKFVDLMQRSTRNTWVSSQAIQELKAMAKGIPASSALVQYMPLKAHAKAKANDGKTNKSFGHALAAFSHLTEKRNAQ